MPKFQVTGDLHVAFTVDIEAENEEEAARIVEAMSPTEIDDLGNTDMMTAGVVIDGVHPDTNEDDDDGPDDNDEPDFEYHPGVDGPR